MTKSIYPLLHTACFTSVSALFCDAPVDCPAALLTICGIPVTCAGVELDNKVYALQMRIPEIQSEDKRCVRKDYFYSCPCF